MTEQEFVIIDEEYVIYAQGNAYVISNGERKFSIWEDEDEAQKVCDYLNEQQNKTKTFKELALDLLDENEEYEKDSENMQQKINVLYHEVLMAKEHMTSQEWERFKQRRKEREEKLGIKWVKL